MPLEKSEGFCHQKYMQLQCEKAHKEVRFISQNWEQRNRRVPEDASLLGGLPGSWVGVSLVRFSGPEVRAAKGGGGGGMRILKSRIENMYYNQRLLKRNYVENLKRTNLSTALSWMTGEGIVGCRRAGAS